MGSIRHIILQFNFLKTSLSSQLLNLLIILILTTNTTSKGKHFFNSPGTKTQDKWTYDTWLSSRVVSVLDSGAEGPGSNRSRDAVG